MSGGESRFRVVELSICCFIILMVMSLPVLPQLSWGGPLPVSGKVAFVCDGDTVILESGERIRYLGIDAPEVAHESTRADCFGDDAKKLNRDMVLHKQVSLEYDGEISDPYGRLLAYVFLPDGRCANLEMLRAGCACIFRSSKDFRRLEEFLLVHREAIQSHRGMWGKCPVKSARSYLGNRESYVFHRPECALGKKTRTSQRFNFASRVAALEQGYRPCRHCKP
jgi:micrococcal nuclease